MAPQQKRSFLPYSRGIEPENIRLGSLYLNPLDPDDGLESRRFDYQENLDQKAYEERIKPWIGREQRDDRGCSLDFQVSKDTSLALKFSDLLKAEAGASSNISATLEGTSGRRLKIRKPEKFLRDEVITQSGVQEWIKDQASIAYKGFFGRHKFKAPEIWMVTGVQLITEGNVLFGSSKTRNGAVGATVDPGVAFGAPPGVASVGLVASHGHGSEATHEYGYDDERVWAAQFMEVRIEYGNEEDRGNRAKDHEPKPAVISTFHLEDIADLKSQGIRATRTERADANGERFIRAPELIAQIVCENINSDEDTDTSSDPGQIQLDDHLFAKELSDTDWDSRDDCSKYLRAAKSSSY